MNPLLVLLAIAAVFGFGYIAGPAGLFGAAVLILLAFIGDRLMKQQHSKD